MALDKGNSHRHRRQRRRDPQSQAMQHLREFVEQQRAYHDGRRGDQRQVSLYRRQLLGQRRRGAQHDHGDQYRRQSDRRSLCERPGPVLFRLQPDRILESLDRHDQPRAFDLGRHLRLLQRPVAAGGATLNLSPGVYIINGGNLSVKGGATINATGGVTIILTSSSGSNYGTVSIAGGTNVNVDRAHHGRDGRARLLPGLATRRRGRPTTSPAARPRTSPARSISRTRP